MRNWDLRVANAVVALVVAVVFLATCAQATAPAGALPASERITVAIDSLNAGIRQLYRDGGAVELLQLLQPDSYPPDSTIPPVVVIVLRP